MSGADVTADNLRLYQYRLAWIVGVCVLQPTEALLLSVAPPGELAPPFDMFRTYPRLRPAEQFRTAARAGTLRGRRVLVGSTGDLVLAPPRLTGPKPVLAVSWPEGRWPGRRAAQLALAVGMDVEQLAATFDLVYLAERPVPKAELRARADALRCTHSDVVVEHDLPTHWPAAALAEAAWRVRGSGPRDHEAMSRAASGDPAGWLALAERGVVAMPSAPGAAWRPESLAYPERWTRRFGGGVLGLGYGPPWTAQLGDDEVTAVYRGGVFEAIELVACLRGVCDPSGESTEAA